MSKKLILALAILSLAFIGTTHAGVEGIKVSGSINSEGVVRDLALGNEGVQDKDDTFLFSQITLQFDADLSEGVSGVLQLVNERIWGAQGTGTSNGNTRLDIHQGYVTFEEFLYQPLTLVAGRQILKYGNGLIIGDSKTASNVVTGVIADLTLTKAFDAVRAILDYAPYTVDIVMATPAENTTNSDDDLTLIGANVAYDWSSFNGVTEGYLWLVDNAANAAGLVDPKNYLYVVGGRAQWDASDKWSIGIEGAYQFGDQYNSATSHQHLNAYAAQLLAEYRFLNSYNAKLNFLYTYLSGDNAGSGGSTAWNPLFENNLQMAGELLHALLTNTNLQIWGIAFSYMPREDITLGLKWGYARQAENNNATTTLTSAYAGGSGTLSYTIDPTNHELGHEIDFWALYDYTEDVQLKFTGAFLLPGDMFVSANDNVGYSIRGGINVDF